MTYDQAKKILDRVKTGVFYPREIVDRALRLTGDLDDYAEDRGEGMVESLQDESWQGRRSSG
ncbi:hypothetical protein EBT31_15625, partial [bacterium]|nr:hypothetical protein [bacterium]